MIIMNFRNSQYYNYHIDEILIFPTRKFQFAAWVDAVIFVFSLENESSFNAVYNFFTKMSHFRNSADVPIILVGTQGIVFFLKNKRIFFIENYSIYRCYKRKQPACDR